MEDISCEFGPVEVLRCLNDGKMTENDVIRWAEAQVATNTTLGQTFTMIDLAALSIDGDNFDRVTALLEKLISEVVDFSISERDVTEARATMESIIRTGEASSIRKDNCIEFLLGCCPQIATALAEKRRFFRGNEPGLYNELAAFTDFLIGAIQRSSNDLAQAAQCLESLYSLGDSEIREAATIGVIEGVINRCKHNVIDLTPFSERRLPNSHRAYDELEVFWQTDHESRRN